MAKMLCCLEAVSYFGLITRRPSLQAEGEKENQTTIRGYSAITGEFPTLSGKPADGHVRSSDAGLAAVNGPEFLIRRG